MPHPWKKENKKHKSPAELPNIQSQATFDHQVSVESENGELKSNLSPPSVPPTSSPSRNNNNPGTYTFYCQLAHGSPTGIISGIASMRDLYSKIAECYGIDHKEIIFCTLNTHKIDMDHLLSGQLGLDDFIFAHVKGQRKEVEVTKSENSLGLTITDNSAGHVFVKRIKPGSVAAGLGSQALEVGDMVEKVNGISYVDKRHFDVAKALKDIPVGTTFVLRLVSPEKTPFALLSSRAASSKKVGAGISSGKKTLRLTANKPVREVDAPNNVEELAIRGICRVLESVLGIDDTELAQSVWELSQGVTNPLGFTEAIQRDMGEFCFSEEAIFDMWGVLQDARQGRLATAGAHGTASSPRRDTEPVALGHF